MAAHVADLLGVLDDAGVRRAVLVGHSMGAFVVARGRPNGRSARAPWCSSTVV
jgi:alpha-beta hydrolase superfamily lysophospholipase